MSASAHSVLHLISATCAIPRPAWLQARATAACSPQACISCVRACASAALLLCALLVGCRPVLRRAAGLCARPVYLGST